MKALNYSFSSDPAIGFAAVMASNGYPVQGPLIPNTDKNQRFDTPDDKPGRKSGYYRLFTRGEFGYGWFGDYRTGTCIKWHYSTGATATDTEAQQQITAFEAECDAKRAEQAARTAKWAKKDWNVGNAKPSEVLKHPYCDHKKFDKDDVRGLRVRTDTYKGKDRPNPSYGKLCLLIPFFDLQGNLHTLQKIWQADDGTFEKRFMVGGAVAGNFYLLGSDEIPPDTALAEGVATAISVHKATGKPVLCCGDCHNMVKVAQVLIEAGYATGDMLVAADNDDHHDDPKIGNPGLKAAQTTAELLGGCYALPDYAPLQSRKPDYPKKADFDDIRIELGLEETANQLNQRVYSLAKLRSLSADEYDQLRKPQAKLRGFSSVTTLDKMLAASNKAHYQSLGVPEYEARPGGTFWNKQDRQTGAITPVQLSHFVARISDDMSYDNGLTCERWLEIEGRQGTTTLPVVRVRATEFSSLHWLKQHWGADGRICPGMENRDRLRDAIESTKEGVGARQVFTHIGWREVGGEWLYMSASGALGAAGWVPELEVLPGKRLQDYSVSLPTRSISDLVDAVELMQTVAAPAIAYPAMLAPMAAILREALPIGFSGFSVGTTGLKKSSHIGVAQSWFGACWNDKKLPEQWKSTAYNLELSAFKAKDSLLVVDDFKPRGNAVDKHRLHNKADDFLRAVANNQFRGRLDSNSEHKDGYPPRSMVWSTGEELPKEESLVARLLVLNYGPGTLDLTILKELRDLAAEGVFCEAAGAFIQWLAPRMSELKTTLPKRYRELQKEFMTANQGHAQQPGILAHFMAVAEVWQQFVTDHGIELGDDWLDTVRDALCKAGAQQAELTQAENPAKQFMGLLGAVLASKRAHLVRLDGCYPMLSDSEPKRYGWQKEKVGTGEFSEVRWVAKGHCIGAYDDDHLYIHPKSAYAAVQSLAKQNDDPLSVSSRRVGTVLKEAGYLVQAQEGRTIAKRTIHNHELSGERFFILPRRGGIVEPIGPNGPDGPNDGKAIDFEEESQGPIDPKIENRMVPETNRMVPDETETIPGTNQGPIETTQGPIEKSEWSQKDALNQLRKKEKIKSGTNGTNGTTNFTHAPPIEESIKPKKLTKSKKEMPIEQQKQVILSGEFRAGRSEQLAQHEKDKLDQFMACIEQNQGGPVKPPVVPKKVPRDGQEAKDLECDLEKLDWDSLKAFIAEHKAEYGLDIDLSRYHTHKALRGAILRAMLEPLEITDDDLPDDLDKPETPNQSPRQRAFIARTRNNRKSAN